MKTLIFSDTHLSHVFNSKQFVLLKAVISSADQVIINGDFWDRYLTTFDQFIKSQWQQLFPLLKKKNAIYLVGNHDLRTTFDDRWQQFATQLADFTIIKRGETIFKIQHGHLQAYSFGSYYPRLTNLFGRLYPLLDRIEQGGHPLTALYRAYLQYEHNDHELLSYAKAHHLKRVWHVFGHSHIQRKIETIGFLNPGSFRCGIGQWLMIDESGHITLHSKQYA
jgi:predicted phosphodiesterase